MALKNPHAVELGRLGGRRSGATRLQATSLATRVRVAQIAAKASWGPNARAKRKARGRKKRIAPQHK